MSETLLPCPFCGGTPILELFNDGFFDYARIRCCRVMFDWCGDETGEQAVAAWNRRANLGSCENELIVRCENCKHYNRIGCSDGFGWCERMDRGTNDDFYCSLADRVKHG